MSDQQDTASECSCGQPARENAYGHSCDQWPLCSRNEHPVDSTSAAMGDPSGMDLDGMFAAIDAGRIADGVSA